MNAIESRLFRWTAAAAAAAASIAAGPPASGQPQRHTYRIEDQLTRETLNAALDPRGRYVAYTITRADRASRGPIGLEALYTGLYGSRLFIRDLANGAQRTIALPGERKLLSFSPSGRYLAFLAVDDRQDIRIGVFDLDQRRDRLLGLSPDAYGVRLLWISDDEFVVSTQPAMNMSTRFATRYAETLRVGERGDVSTASELSTRGGGGADPRALTRVDLSREQVRNIVDGLIWDRSLSPSGDWLALVHDQAGFPQVDGAQLEAAGGNAFLRGPMSLYGTRTTALAHDICRCQVVYDSLRWSADSRQLAFAAITPGHGIRLWRYDVTTEAAAPVDLAGLQPATPYRFAWLGRNLVVEGAARSDAPRRDWFLLGLGLTPRNFTARLAGQPDFLAMAPNGDLLFTADRRLWRTRDGVAWRALAEVGDGALSPLTENRGLGSSMPSTAARLLLRRRTRDGDELLRLDLTTNRLQAFPASVAGQVLGADWDGRSMLRTRPNGESTELVLGDLERQRETRLVTINEHLNVVVRGGARALRHRVANGDEVTSWLLLPPAAAAGRRLPLVVQIYPGLQYPAGARPDTLTGTAGLNVNMLTGRGYAVLLPSLPPRRSGSGDPLRDLAADIQSAVDAANDTGFIDRDRMVIQGQSFGAYGTARAITQLHIFKAAVAVAGYYNAFSVYGAQRAKGRLNDYLDVRSVYQATSLEYFQGDLGVPPWRDIARYARNSPLLQVENIATPLMLIHGDLDSTIPFSQSEELFTALYRLDKPVRFVRYWGEDHAITSPANLRDMWRRIFAFYDEAIGPPDADATASRPMPGVLSQLPQ